MHIRRGLLGDEMKKIIILACLVLFAAIPIYGQEKVDSSKINLTKEKVWQPEIATADVGIHHVVVYMYKGYPCVEVFYGPMDANGNIKLISRQITIEGQTEYDAVLGSDWDKIVQRLIPYVNDAASALPDKK
jgi:hypothetical protein